MDKLLSLAQMEESLKVYIKTVKNKGKAPILMQVEMYILVGGKMEKNMGKVPILGQMEGSI